MKIIFKVLSIDSKERFVIEFIKNIERINPNIKDIPLYELAFFFAVSLLKAYQIILISFRF